MSSFGLWLHRCALLTAFAAVPLLAGCSPDGPEPAGSTLPTTPPAARDGVPLPSDGWKPGDVALDALSVGRFHAVQVDGNACAWLGDKRAPFRWPAGWSVTFTPKPRLVNARGDVVAVEGQRVSFGGGGDNARDANACGTKGEWTFYVMQE